MANKSFKDYYEIDKTIPAQTEVAIEPIIKKVDVIEEKKTEFTLEVARQQLREEIESQIKDKLTEEITESVRKEYESNLQKLVEERVTKKLDAHYKVEFEEVKKSLEENMIQKHTILLDTNNEKLIGVINVLIEKINMLESSMNIQVPTPIVNVTIPDRKVIKQVHRDADGLITHISEHITTGTDPDSN